MLLRNIPRIHPFKTLQPTLHPAQQLPWAQWSGQDRPPDITFTPERPLHLLTGFASLLITRMFFFPQNVLKCLSQRVNLIIYNWCHPLFIKSPTLFFLSHNRRSSFVILGGSRNRSLQRHMYHISAPIASQGSVLHGIVFRCNMRQPYITSDAVVGSIVQCTYFKAALYWRWLPECVRMSGGGTTLALLQSNLPLLLLHNEIFAPTSHTDTHTLFLLYSAKDEQPPP